MDVTVESNQRLIEGVQRMELGAAEVFRVRDPQRRAVLWLTAAGEQVPLTVAEADASRGVVTVVFKVSGAATEWLASRQVDEPVPGLVVVDLPTYARTRRAAMLAGLACAVTGVAALALWLAPAIDWGGGDPQPAAAEAPGPAAAEAAPAPAEAPAPRSRPDRPRRARPAPAPEPPRDVAGLPPGVRPGFLSLLSLPPCEVLVDGVEVGTTPLIKHPLTPGEHAVRLRRPADRLDQHLQVLIKQGKITQEHFRFTPGQVEFRAHPGTEIWLGETRLGVTPFKPLKMYSGRYVFRAVDETLNKEVSFSAQVAGGRKNVIPVKIHGNWSPGAPDPRLGAPATPVKKAEDSEDGDFE